MLLLPLILLVAVGSCSGQQGWREDYEEDDYGQCLTTHGPPTRTDPNTRRELIRSRLEFSLAFFKEVAKEAPSQNIFMSPLSVYNTLMLAYFTAAGHTEQSIRTALSLPTSLDKADVLKAYSVHKHNLMYGRYKSQVHSANRLFISDQQTVKGCMIDLFNDEIEVVDFTPQGLSQTAQKINFWVSNHTNNKIQNIVSEKTLSPNAQIVLANAAYFKGTWKNQFDPIDTKPRKFYVSKNKTVMTPMMFQLNEFSHWRSDRIGAELLELPYIGPSETKGNISLILMLPDESNSPHPASDLVLRLNSATLLDIIRESSNPNNEDKLEVRMPKFSLESTFELSDTLEKMGVGDLFSPTSNLTGLTGGPKINLNSAIHKAKVKVDEFGTEAAAATIFTETRIPGENFYLDHPFVYLLYDKTEESLLFAGVYNYPEESS